MSFCTQRFTCSKVTLQTPALRKEGTLGGPKIIEVRGNTVGVLLVIAVRDSLVLFEVELFLSQRGFVIDGRKSKQCTERTMSSILMLKKSSKWRPNDITVCINVDFYFTLHQQFSFQAHSQTVMFLDNNSLKS